VGVGDESSLLINKFHDSRQKASDVFHALGSVRGKHSTLR
jgi:hypothetical protein